MAVLGATAFLLSRPAAAQPVRAFEHIAQERGLSNGTVTAIVQDRAGLLWFGTEDGLNRYAGAGFSVFHRVERDPTSLADGWITGLAVGRDGTIWASTLHGGLQRFVPESEHFRRYQHDDSDPTSLSSNRVNAIMEGEDGAIWAGTVRGLDRVDPATGRARHFLVDSTDAGALGNDVLAIAPGAAGTIWIGGRTGLFQLDPRRGTLAAVRDPVPWFPIRAIHQDRRGTLWVASENALVAVDPATRTVVAHYGQPTPAHDSPIAGRALAITEDAAGVLWIGSDGGLTRLDPATRTWEHHRYRRGDPTSIAGEIVRSLLVDRGGVVWAGLESYGLSKYAPSQVRFGVIRHDPNEQNTLSDGYARGMTQDHAGNLWIATQNGGFNRRDARTGTLTAYRHRAGDPTSLPNDNAWAIHEDATGTLWVGLHYAGLGTLDPATGRFTRSPLVPADANVNLITEDRAGRLLVGLEGRGLVEIDAARQHARTYGARVGDTRILVNDDVQTIREDRAGRLWIGGVDGLSRLDRRTGRVARYRGIPGQPGALGTDFVTDVLEDHAGTIWVATKGSGFARYDARTDRFTTVGVADGLPHPFVYGMLEDARGRLWLSTDDGLAAYDPRTGDIARYGLADGLQAREFNRRAYYRAPDGTMYFGGINGVNVFRPEDFAPPPPPPPVALVALVPADGSASHILLAPAPQTTVRLPSEVGGFRIAYAGLDYTAPEKIQYAYRLDGVDRGWVTAGDRREAAYASVRPGTYTFHVIAANASGRWNRTGASLTIVVATPWWATWWARVLFVVTGIGLVAGVVHLRVVALDRQRARLARRVAEQTRDLTAAQEQLRAALERERESARELADITSAMPGAVFRLREAPDGTRVFVFVSEGVAPLARGLAPTLDRAPMEPDDPRALAERVFAAVHADDVSRLAASLDASRSALTPWHAELRCVAIDDTERWIVAHAIPSRDADGATTWTGVMTDGTPARRAEAERAALETRVLQAQKAESLAVLAGGIAHDFNNLLVGVLANADLLREDLPPASAAAEAAALIRDSALRAAELTQQMLAYAGRGRLVVERVDLARLAPEMMALVRAGVPRAIAIDVSAASPSVPVHADATQLRQLVLNLATNAAEAIGERGGRVSVHVGIETAPQRELALRHVASDMPAHGPYAVLEVADDGCGMDPALVDRIFDPFYTTKFTGRGLGLAALLGVVRAHHGGLRVATAPGRGARFTLYFPLLAPSADAPEAAAEPTSAPAAAPNATSRATRVLIVDDEPAILRTTARVLRAAGYEVETADDGAAAVERLTGGEAVDVVLMDMTMPRLDGLRAATALRAQGVLVPIVLMSGYSEEELADRGQAAGIDGFLKKPFTPAEIRAAVESSAAQPSR